MVNLTTLQSDNRAALQDFADEVINKTVTSRDNDRTFDKAIWKECADLNLHGIFISKEYGGLEYSLLDGMSMLESMGYCFRDNGLSFAIIAQLTSCSIAIDKSESSSHKEKYLVDILKGNIIFAHGLSESSSGSYGFSMNTKYNVVESSQQVNIKGHKTYCSNLPIADFMLCYANKQSENVEQPVSSALIIPCELISDIESIQKLGLHSCPMGRATFDLNIPIENILGEEGSGLTTFQHAILHERIGMSACHLGTVERILNEAIKWTNTRTVGGAPLASKQAITHPLVNIYNDWVILRSYLYKLTSAEMSFSKLYLSASTLKDKVSELYTHACTQILQIYGGLGYTQEHEIERMLRDSMASKIYSGTSEIHKEIIWKYIS